MGCLSSVSPGPAFGVGQMNRNLPLAQRLTQLEDAEGVPFPWQWPSESLLISNEAVVSGLVMLLGYTFGRGLLAFSLS